MQINDLGKPIGRWTNVYTWGVSQVVKVYDADVPLASITGAWEREKGLYEAGLPVPAVRELVEIEGLHGQVYELTEGRTFADEMLTVANADEECIERLAGQFAEAQAAIHLAEVPGVSLPDQKEFLADILAGIHILPDDLKSGVERRLAELSGGSRICHGDYHPFNVIQSPHGPIVVEWTRAHRGNPMEDLAHTTLLSVGFGRMMPEIDEAVDRFIEVSLARYFELTGADRAAMEAWWPVVCALRLADPVTELYPWLLAEVRRSLDGH